MVFFTKAYPFVAALIVLVVHLVTPQPTKASVRETEDWPMAGGRASRNAVTQMPGIPVEWDASDAKSFKWVASLGSISYTTPVISHGMVFVGTNNEGLRDPALEGDRGVLMAFRESDGEFLWQATSEKLASGQVNDWPEQGICSTPTTQSWASWAS